MGKIQVGSTTTKYGPNGEVVSETESPSYLIKEDGTKVELTKEEAKQYGIGREPEEISVDFAKLEAMMFRQIEIKDARAGMLEESQLNNIKILQLLQEANMNEHIAKFNENFELKATIIQDRQMVFDKEKLADDLGVSPSSIQKKDVLINLTEKGKLTLDKFKEYFHSEPTIKLSVRKVKIKKSRKKNIK
jgi:hypothetical protein